MHTRAHWAWFQAVSDAQKSGDLAPIIKLLRLENEMPRTAREMLAELLERHHLKKKRGGQRTPMFNLSMKGRLARAASLARRLQRGEVAPITDLFNELPREQLKRLCRSEPIGLTPAMLSKRPKPMKRQEAIDKAAIVYEIDAQKLADFMDGLIGFSRKKRPTRL
jgi:hypothetical protein